MKTKPNDSAGVIPASIDQMNEIIYGADGLTKREYFAAMAMQGLCSTGIDYSDDTTTTIDCAKKMASWSVQQADYLIEELNK